MRAVIVFLATLLTAVVAFVSFAAPSRGVSPRSSTSSEPRRYVSNVIDEGRFAVRVFTDRDGLPQNTINTIASDAQRYLWIGTQDGAARFNGRSWTVINMPDEASSNTVSAILATSDGAVWFGTRGELFRLFGGKWMRYGLEAGIPHDGVSSLLALKSPSGPERIVVGTFSRGILEFDGRSFATLNGDMTSAAWDVRCMLASDEGGDSPKLWVGTTRGLGLFEHGSWRHFGVTDGLPSDHITSLAEAPNLAGARVLVAGTTAGVAFLKPGGWSTEVIPGEHPRRSKLNRIESILVTEESDGESTIWAGTEGGLIRRHAGVWRILRSESGLPGVTVRALAKPPTGTAPTLFIGTDGEGLGRIDIGKLAVFDDKTGLPAKSVRCFLETGVESGERAFWFGTEGGGLARFDTLSGRWKVDDTSTGFPSDSVRCLVEAPAPDGTQTLWIGTEDRGLVARSKGRDRLISSKNGLSNDRVRALLPSVDESGRPVLWIGTLGGLSLLGPDGVVAIDGLRSVGSESVLALCETTAKDGERTLWVGTTSGLAQLSHGQWSRLDRTTGLVNDSILSLRAVTERDAKKALWVGTRGGVTRLSLETGKPIASLTRSSTPALPNTVIYEIREDATGRIYLLTNSGVVRFTPRTPTSDDPAEFAVRSFTVEDGLPSNEGNLGASYVDSKGRIWEGTVAGAVAFDPSPDYEDREPKPVVIERTLVDGRNFELANATLGYSERNISIEFALLSYVHEANARYRTQLAGFDLVPTPWTTDFKREFTALPAGTYTFQVWGRDYAGNESGPAEITFTVRPAPWFSWWAFALYGLALAALIYSVLQLKTHALQRHTEILEAKVAERTAEIEDGLARVRNSEKQAQQASEAKSTFLANMSHELRTPLNAIFGFVQLMERDGGLTHRQRENLGIIARNSEHLLGLINDVLSITKIEAGQLSLNEQVFDLKRVIRGLEDLFRLRCESKGLTLQIEVAQDLPLLVWGDEGKLRQVLINLVANAVKFTEEGSITVRARHSDGRGWFEVADTGPGLARAELERLFQSFTQTETGQRSQEGTGLGLAISLSFVRLMGGDIAVSSEPGRGACFTFDIRLPASVAPGTRADTSRIVGLTPGQPIYRVLVVDDKWENRSLLAQLLASVGFQVLEAADGKEAVEAWTHWNPDVIWMDMRMPVMDGYEAVRTIRSYGVRGEQPANTGASVEEWRERSTKVVIIALTAGAFDHDRERVLAAGCDDIVIKPFREETVFEKMEEFLGVSYERVDTSSPSRPTDGLARVSADRLAAIPVEELDRLNSAIDAGAIDEAREALDAIAPLDEALANELWEMIKNYQFDEVQELLTRPAAKRE